MALLALSGASALSLAIAGILVFAVSRILYNVYLHPLRRFPGPFVHRATRLAFLYRFMKGTLPKDMLALHDKYGPVVRIAPNELAFNDPTAWRDIYGHKANEFPKLQAFYKPRKTPDHLVTENRTNHRNIRLTLAPGFSDRSMREQEPVFRKYTNLLVSRLREHSAAPKPLDMVSWYTWTTFDIVGDLAFGEPFGCLERVTDDPWINGIFNALKYAPFVATVTYYGLDNLLLPLLNASVRKGRTLHDAFTEAKLRRRMELKTERHDLIEGLLKNTEKLNMDITSLRSNASILILAGSETTSTLLSGATYLLLRNPIALQKLTDEVRSSFDSEAEIDLLSVSKLSYMLACLNEALRLYPPVPGGLPRVVPRGRGNVTIAGEVIPDDNVVAVWHWAAYHSSSNFTDPFGFHPERFLKTDERFAHDKFDILQPFSVGPRNCIGRNLAYAEMRLILAKIIYNFDMRLADESIDWLDHECSILHSKPPLPVYLTPVARNFSV